MRQDGARWLQEGNGTGGRGGGGDSKPVDGVQGGGERSETRDGAAGQRRDWWNWVHQAGSKFTAASRLTWEPLKTQSQVSTAKNMSLGSSGFKLTLLYILLSPKSIFGKTQSVCCFFLLLLLLEAADMWSVQSLISDAKQSRGAAEMSALVFHNLKILKHCVFQDHISSLSGLQTK